MRPRKKCLIRLATSCESGLYSFHCLLDACCGQRRAFKCQRASRHPIAAEMQLIMRHELAMHALAFAINADISCLGLGATVMTSGNPDFQIMGATAQFRSENRA